MRYALILLHLLVVTNIALSQQTELSPPQTTIDNISSKTLSKLSDRFASLTNAIQDRSDKVLAQMQKRESSLKNQVSKTDSVKAASLFNSAQSSYQSLRDKLLAGASPGTSNLSTLKEYIPNVDSISNVLHFLQDGHVNLPADKLQQVQALSNQYQLLQSKLQDANEINAFIKAREAVLTQQLSQYNLAGAQLGINKQVYYYETQLAQYKADLKDPDKLEGVLLNAVTRLPTFQSYMAKNCFLARAFPASPNVGTPEAIQGLQTIADTKQQLQDRFGKDALTPDPSTGSSPLQGQVQLAQMGLSKLKDRIAAAGGGNSDMTLPTFTPNQQKTKSFLKRFEYGFNFQSQGNTSLLPVTTDLGLTIGYKLNANAVIGVGTAYRIGWGNGLDNIHMSSQGAGLRSYADIRARGSIWITGGWEYNYYQAFSKLSSIANLDVWQKSALVGITKKYKIGKQNGNMQLLYDFLASQQIPQAPAVKFRIGYTF